MDQGLILGMVLVLAGGLFQGSFMFPSKFMKGWEWENYWLVFAATAYLLCPWAVALATVPRLAEIYSGVSARAFGSAALFGAGWGLGALTFGLGVNAVGLALGFAVIVGVAAVAGMLIPLIAAPAAVSGRQFGLALAAAAVMLAGVAVCSLAGRWRDTGGAGSRGYARGLALCVASGLLSACGNLGFAFGTEVLRRAESLGVLPQYATTALWTLLTFPLFLCNAGYAVHLLVRNRTMGRYRHVSAGKLAALAVSMGLMWMAGMTLYGMGATKLGPLGSSVGFAILMSTMVLVANALGLATGEWSEAPPAARRQLWAGIGTLVGAIVLLGYANRV